MTFRVRSTMSDGMTVSKWPGLGIPGSEIPTAGGSGGSPLANDGISPTSEYRIATVSAPPAGTLTVYPDTSFDFAGPDGSYTWSFNVWENNVLLSGGPEVVTLTIGVAVQVARPVADLSNTGWVPSSGADLHPMIGETVRDDVTHIAATVVGALCEVDLADLADPAVSTGHLPTLVLSAPGGGGVTIRLRQGTTTIATWTYYPGATPTEYTPTLSGAEADSITDYTALRLQFEAVA